MPGWLGWYVWIHCPIAQRHLPPCRCAAHRRTLTRTCGPAETRAGAACASSALALRWTAAAAPRPTNSSLANLRRAFSLKAVIAHRRLSSQAKMPLATCGSEQRMARQCLDAPACAIVLSKRSTSGEVSAHAPNTKPRIGPKPLSRLCTGPMMPVAVPQYFSSTWRALAVYSACRARARRATASHLAVSAPP